MRQPNHLDLQQLGGEIRLPIAFIIVTTFSP